MRSRTARRQDQDNGADRRWLALFDVDWRNFLAPGETAYVLVVAKDTMQATVAFGYIASLILEHPVLKASGRSSTADTIEPAQSRHHPGRRRRFRGLRGYAIAA